ncbi:hypothetical protein B0H13DRAFT_2349340 [Mycena leptocephala]|nr:hypothetical protein B0H13DRAFT_2349340 [Mycena leptocephala]
MQWKYAKPKNDSLKPLSNTNGYSAMVISLKERAKDLTVEIHLPPPLVLADDLPYDTDEFKHTDAYDDLDIPEVSSVQKQMASLDASAAPVMEKLCERYPIDNHPSFPTKRVVTIGVLHDRKLKLKPEGIMRLEDFSKMATSASEVAMFAQMLKITEIQALLSPANTPFTIPEQLDNKIDIHNIRTLLSPSLAYYFKKSGRTLPASIMKVLILEHADAWGVPPKVLDDRAQWGVISTRVRTRLTDHHYEVKKVIFDSVWVVVKSEDGEPINTDHEDPLNIIQLCEALVNMVPEAGLKVTFPMLGRVTLLRHIVIDVNGGQKFWDKVDEELVAIRNKF